MTDLDALAADGFGHWLAGFIDGEGCFLLNAYRIGDGRVRHRARFKLTLRDDDAGILYEIEGRTGIGEVILRPRTGLRWGDQATWQAIRQDDLEALCRIIDRFSLRAKKQADYEIWREAVAISRKYRGGDLRRLAANTSVWDRLAELRAMLTDARSYAFGDEA